MERLDLDAVQSYLDQVSYATVDAVTFAIAKTMGGNLMLSREDLSEADRIVQTALDALGYTRDDLIARTALCTGELLRLCAPHLGDRDLADRAARGSTRKALSLPVSPSPASWRWST